MKQILEYILSSCAFLYEHNRFRFVDSYVAESFGGDALLILASKLLRLRFVSDRAQLFLDFQASDQTNKKKWYSMDVVRQYVTGESEYHSIMNGENAEFIRTHLDELEAMFSPARVDDTSRELKRLEKLRAKRLFG